MAKVVKKDRKFIENKTTEIDNSMSIIEKRVKVLWTDIYYIVKILKKIEKKIKRAKKWKMK